MKMMKTIINTITIRKEIMIMFLEKVINLIMTIVLMIGITMIAVVTILIQMTLATIRVVVTIIG